MSEKIRKRGRDSVLDQFRNEIGVLSHGEIAEKAGCSPANVYMYARRHGLLGTVSEPKSEPSVRGSVLDEHRWMMGRFTDALIAKVAGCTAANVSIYRRKHGIPRVTPEMLVEVKAAVGRIDLCLTA